MGKEDKKRYFMAVSIYLEIVTPLFQQKLDEKYKSLNFRCLNNFLDDKAVIHILFHLCHRNACCCTDKENCTTKGVFPLNHHQWKKLYAENPGTCIQNCFCKYTAKSVKSGDLDLSLCGLILFNCCHLSQLDGEAVQILRRNKNDFLSHNTACGISKDDYDSLLDEIKTNILQLDQTKEDELIRIQKRPLDDDLCNEYMTTVIDFHAILERIDTKIEISTAQISDTININNAEMTAKIEKLMQKAVCQNCTDKLDKEGIEDQPMQPYKLGQTIFTLQNQIELSTVVGDEMRGEVTDMVMMNDGRLVMCLPWKYRLLICTIDGSRVDRIDIQDQPYSVTSITNSAVAVIQAGSDHIEMYDINNKLKLKSISVPRMCWGSGITTINNKLVVASDMRLLIIDHQTREVVQTIQTGCDPWRVHGSGDRIFYCEYNNNNNLYWYSNTDDRHHYLTLQSLPVSMTSLQDGSLYVKCWDGSVQHVSSDGKQYETVSTDEFKKLEYTLLSYNSMQRELVSREDQSLMFKVFYNK